jgi:hypothetical protein
LRARPTAAVSDSSPDFPRTAIWTVFDRPRAANSTKPLARNLAEQSRYAWGDDALAWPSAAQECLPRPGVSQAVADAVDGSLFSIPR